MPTVPRFNFRSRYSRPASGMSPRCSVGSSPCLLTNSLCTTSSPLSTRCSSDVASSGTTRAWPRLTRPTGSSAGSATNRRHELASLSTLEARATSSAPRTASPSTPTHARSCAWPASALSSPGTTASSTSTSSRTRSLASSSQPTGSSLLTHQALASHESDHSAVWISSAAGLFSGVRESRTHDRAVIL